MDGGYRGRFHEKAKELVKSGTCVGIMYIDTADTKKYDEEYYEPNRPTFSNEKLQVWLKDNPIPKQIEKFITDDGNDGLLGFGDNPSRDNLYYSVKKISDLC